MESELIEMALDLCGGNVARAAAKLEISPSTLYRKRDRAMPRRRHRHAARQVKPLALAEAEMIRAAMAACSGNISRSAAALGINPSTLYRKIQSKDLPEP
jgi:DNA-binding NtrC family response regulator